MRAFWIVLSLLWMPLVWADDYAVSVTQRSNITRLTTEAATVVPAITGAHEELAMNQVVFTRVAGTDFTADEKTLIHQAVQAHDPQKPDDTAPLDIPIEAFGAGLAGALAAFGGRNLVLNVQKKSSG